MKPVTAAQMGALRWKGTTKKERSEAMRELVAKRWAKAKKKRRSRSRSVR